MFIFLLGWLEPELDTETLVRPTEFRFWIVRNQYPELRWKMGMVLCIFSI